MDMKSISKSLQNAAREVLEGKIKHPNQQKLDVHEPEKDELTSKDFEMLRTGKKAKMKEEVDMVEAVSAELKAKRLPMIKAAAEKIAKKNKEQERLAKSAAKKHMSQSGATKGMASTKKDDIEEAASAELKAKRLPMIKAAAEKIAKKNKEQERLAKSAAKKHMSQSGATKGMASTKKDDMEESVQYSESVLVVNNFEPKDRYSFSEHLLAAKRLVGEEEAINIANESYNVQNNAFIELAALEDAVDQKIDTLVNEGHEVSEPKYNTESGDIYVEYIVKDKDSGNHYRYIHSSSTVSAGE